MIEIHRMEPDGLKGQLWHFRVTTAGFGASNDVAVLCCLYAEVARETPRHKVRWVRKWDQMDERSYNSDIKREEVPLPADVVCEAINTVPIFVRVGPS